jgi:hypothetical protein
MMACKRYKTEYLIGAEYPGRRGSRQCRPGDLRKSMHEVRFWAPEMHFTPLEEQENAP